MSRKHARILSSVLFRFGIVYGLLVAPWPGWKGAYATLFRSTGPVLLAPFWPGGAVRFVGLQPHDRTERGIDTKVLLLRRGSTVEVWATIDSRRTGYLPASFLVALVCATPVPWSRRMRALFWGLLAVQVFVGARISASLADAIPGGAGLPRALQAFLSHHLRASGFVTVLLIWLLSTLRPGDWDSILRGRDVEGGAVAHARHLPPG